MVPLHREMGYLSMVGDLLKDSSWTTIITNAQIARSAVTESLILWHSMIQNKYSHQVAASAFYKLQHQAYIDRQEKSKLLVFVDYLQNGTFPVSISPVSLCWKF